MMRRQGGLVTVEALPPAISRECLSLCPELIVVYRLLFHQLSDGGLPTFFML